jgi:hypothetical protein
VVGGREFIIGDEGVRYGREGETHVRKGESTHGEWRCMRGLKDEWRLT